MRQKILFIGKANTINCDLFQALEQSYNMKSCAGIDNAIEDSIQLTRPDAVLVSLIGRDYNFMKIFTLMAREYSDIPVITIGTEYESKDYTKFYGMPQFHIILRPVTGIEVLEKCNKILGVVEERLEITEEPACERKAMMEPARILVVDDNAMVLRNVKLLLSDKYNVALAVSGAQAFANIFKKKPDLILLDYDMPMMNGQAAIEILHANEELKDIPVIFLTSASDRNTVKKLISLKPAGYILKPVNKDALTSVIKDVLRKPSCA